MSATRNKVTKRATFWATHEPKLRAMILEHIAALVDKAADDGADDLADAGRDALVLLRAAAEPEAKDDIPACVREMIADLSVCQHVYPSPWFGTVPAPCMKCGR